MTAKTARAGKKSIEERLLDLEARHVKEMHRQADVQMSLLGVIRDLHITIEALRAELVLQRTERDRAKRLIDLAEAIEARERARDAADDTHADEEGD